MSKPNLGNLRFLSAVGINAANIKIHGVMSQPAPKAELAPMNLIADIATIIARIVSISKDISNLPGLSPHTMPARKAAGDWL